MDKELSGLIIRYAKKKDLRQVMDIYNQAIVRGNTIAITEPVKLSNMKQWFRQHKQNEYPVCVAVFEHQVVGWLSLSPYRLGRHAVRATAEVSYFVRDEFQRKGIASRLLEHSIGNCRAFGISTLLAVLLDINLPSINLLKKHHFEQWGRLPNVVKLPGHTCSHVYYGLSLDA